MKAPLFYSKILLFGEYGIIKNSKGLSIPYNFFKGGFKLGDLNNQEVKKSNNNLRLFKDFISKLDNTIVAFDLNKMDNDLNMGMYFDSTIPQGYGVGSSGALVAAIYDRYAQNKITVLENLTKEKILVLKHVFSEMESYFHGKSSGLDPLNSYLSLPILMHSKNKVETTWIPSQFYNGKGAVFLLDSGESSDTAPMVEIFFESMKNKEYSKIIKEDFINTTDNCVDDFLKADFKSLFLNIKKLSKVVLKNFKPMIPEDFHNIWAKGIESNDYFLKLCGSGGGGYILGFSQDFEKAKSALRDYKLEVVYNF
ncbi:MAG: mevalonate kinase [Flavobacteriaceae bacterium]|jgi:mevalonate kinase|nr:mevalonate kinase [Flavobacteriaceae bacterium]MBT3753976.1 mevalonate kinase [Flavobacteriaceae bacterium]MBT4063418.1 mevalonate kinase [Flavobacteriaceae bacterium]MBT4246229.1 mevalonate kinase [Flavobacteriaceae bacterium]MBT4415836.1 mevalonate kinase [Flavobacteriaceae bacterium]|tara:strand:- start:2361 stop:3290 length:930 start_codon:yes stop_codon:yes gene_type:complete